MWKRHPARAVAVLPPVIDLPTGNVHVAAAAEPSPVLHGLPRQDVPDDAPPSWSVRDGNGTVIAADLPTRAAALRLLGALAFRGATLPLTVYDAAGRPTGDRLA